MRTRTEKITVQMSSAERQMLEHLAMAERVPKAFILRRLVREAADELYATIKAASSSGCSLEECAGQQQRQETKSV